jgi:hypothetical protein
MWLRRYISAIVPFTSTSLSHGWWHGAVEALYTIPASRMSWDMWATVVSLLLFSWSPETSDQAAK